MFREFHRHRAQQGFTFNELLVAMNVVAVAVLGLSISMMSIVRGNRGSDSHTIATNLAHDQIETLRASNNFAIEDGCSGGGDTAVSPVGAPGGIFSICWKIEPSALGGRLKQIEVAVSWHEQGDRQVTLSTLVFDEGDF